MTTQAVIDHFDAEGIVFSGIAGGVNPGLNIGDVVVPAHTWRNGPGGNCADTCREIFFILILDEFSPALPGLPHPGTAGNTTTNLEKSELEAHHSAEFILSSAL
jgi:hypothetical protein